jgi:ATP-dependent DNA helicase RecQ
VSVPAQKLLSAVWRTGQRFGAAHLVDVLLGADTERIRALGHRELSVYGIGGELDKEQWRALIRQLTALGLLVPVPEGRGGLQWGLEEEVRAVLRGERQLELPLPPPRKERRRSGSRAGSTGPAAGAAAAAEWGEADPQLVAALKAWRTDQARQQAVPPYVVFHDRTLLELASRRPASLAELAEVGGIGAAKLERYGTALLAVLAGT